MCQSDTKLSSIHQITATIYVDQTDKEATTHIAISFIFFVCLLHKVTSHNTCPLPVSLTMCSWPCCLAFQLKIRIQFTLSCYSQITKPMNQSLNHHWFVASIVIGHKAGISSWPLSYMKLTDLGIHTLQGSQNPIERCRF